jgi:hypothetical protein
MGAARAEGDRLQARKERLAACGVSMSDMIGSGWVLAVGIFLWRYLS